MACRVEKVNNEELQFYIDKYGVNEGLNKFLSGEKEASFLIDPNQTSMDFNSQENYEKEVAKKEWETLCKISGLDKNEKSHSNVRLKSVGEELRRRYPYLKIEISPSSVKNYVDVTIHNPDVEYYKKNNNISYLMPSEKSTSVKKKNPIAEVVLRRKTMIQLLQQKQ